MGSSESQKQTNHNAKQHRNAQKGFIFISVGRAVKCILHVSGMNKLK